MSTAGLVGLAVVGGWLALAVVLAVAWHWAHRRHRHAEARYGRQRTAELFGGGHVLRVPRSAVGLPALPGDVPAAGQESARR